MNMGFIPLGNAWATIIAMFAILAALWVGATISAPIRQRNEAREFVGQLVAARSNLSTFIRDGRDLQYKVVRSDDELDSWLTNYDQWVANTGEAIEAVYGSAEQELFNTLEGVLAAHKSGSYNGHHNSKRLYLDYRLSTLRDLVRRRG